MVSATNGATIMGTVGDVIGLVLLVIVGVPIMVWLIASLGYMLAVSLATAVLWVYYLVKGLIYLLLGKDDRYL
jgi:hypothetical protein